MAAFYRDRFVVNIFHSARMSLRRLALPGVPRALCACLQLRSAEKNSRVEIRGYMRAAGDAGVLSCYTRYASVNRFCHRPRIRI